jgi:hypothetical protein
VILSNEHASVYASILIADHRLRLVLVSMAGPKTAVKAIYASLQTTYMRWLRVEEEGSSNSAAVVRGGLRYRTKVGQLPAVKGVHMLIVAHDNHAPAGYTYVLSEGQHGLALARSLDADPGLVVPVLPIWGDYLLTRGLEAVASFPEVVDDAPGRLVESLQVHRDSHREGGIDAAYAYARDNDSWLALVDRGLAGGRIALSDRLKAEDRAWVLAAPEPKRGDP